MKTRSSLAILLHVVLGLILWAVGPVVEAQPITCTVSQAGNSVVISWNTVAAKRYTVETKSSLMEPWEEHTVITATNELLSLTVLAESSTRFFRVAEGESNPPEMVLVPAGSFDMGNSTNPSEGDSNELPVHSVSVSAFLIDQYEVSKALWDEVYSWAITNEYTFQNTGSGKGTNHPVHTVSWYDAVKWCNARSEKEGRVPAYYTSTSQTTVYRTGRVDVQNEWVNWNAGYRLPTEAEWEKAARGGLSGNRFPWGDTISWNEANYSAYPLSAGGYPYDTNPKEGVNPDWLGVGPYTSPVGSFDPNAYGLYDMAGNLNEWCWDSYGAYSGDAQVDPRGPAADFYRVLRGGSWYRFAKQCRVSFRWSQGADIKYYHIGFRSVLPPGPP